jgi:hypothetical protein
VAHAISPPKGDDRIMKFARRSAHDAPGAIRRVLSKIRGFRLRRPTSPAGGHVRRWELRLVIGVALLATLTVVGIAAAISYSHMQDWATKNHEPDWRAALFPISVDGAILAASMIIYADSRTKKTDPLAYLIALGGMGMTVFANIGHDWIDYKAAWIIAGWPPVAMAALVELLFRFVRRLRERADREQTRVAARPVTLTAPTAKPKPAAEAKPLVVDGRPDWMPADATIGDAMAAYLRHVSADVTGADLHRLVAVPYFGATKDTGRGRQIVRDFKAALAAEADATGQE